MRIPLLIALFCCCLATAAVGQKIRPRSSDQTAVPYAKQVQQGFSMRIWLSNQMAMGEQAWDTDQFQFFPYVGLEYPAGSNIEHLYAAGPWVGGIVNGVRRVSEGYNGDDASKYFLPDRLHPLRDRIWFTSTNNLNEPNRRGIDDDGDGKIDEDELDGLDNDGDWVLALDDVGSDGIPDSLESGCKGGYNALANPDPAYDDYDPAALDLCHSTAPGIFRHKNDKDLYTEKNGIPDHGEPHVDEDYGAVSESDVYISATDTTNFTRHVPMGLRMTQKSYAWSAPAGEAILPMEYTLVNIGHDVIHSVYIAFYVDSDVGPKDINAYPTHNYSCYLDTLHTAFAQNPVDRGSTPLGLTLLSAPRPLSQLNYFFHWFDAATPTPGTVDSILYEWMDGGFFPNQFVQPCQSQTGLSDSRYFFSFGPFDDLRPGDSLKYSVAFVSGFGVDAGEGNMTENIRRVIVLHQRSFHLPAPPPSPALRVISGPHSITIDWSGDARPESFVDPYDPTVSALPDTDWRRAHVAGPGGHTFEGFRVWRSSSPEFDSTSFVELARYDVNDGLGLGAQTGLKYSFVDSSVSPGVPYWYAVTSYGIPGRYLQPEWDPDSVRNDTIQTAGLESNVRENATRALFGFSAASTGDQVLVVPNPYRGDNRYPGGGGLSMFAGAFNGDNGLIWFIHLPKKATIRIFTLAGDIITTLQHDDVRRAASGLFTGQEEWRILTESGAALASGIYLYSVESDLGTQIGKFVILR